MKTPFATLSFVFFFVVFSFMAQGQALQIASRQISQIDSICRSYFESTGGVVLLAQQGTPVFSKAYGNANAELQVKMSTDHKLGIGSVSKQFAAVAMLLLQKEGKLNVKDDIRKHLPSYNTHGRTITIEHILSHTSGIPSYSELYGFDTLVNNKSVSNAALVRFFETPDLLFEPGTDWSYSNSGFVLAALIVEKITGKPFNDFLTERIFKPLHMTGTSIGTSDFTLPGKTGEYGRGVPNGQYKLETQYNWYWAYGAGQIMSTVQDMLKWDEALYNEKFLPGALVSQAHKSFMLANGQPANYGLGWGIGIIKYKPLIQHGGAIGGYRAQAVRVPDDHLYLVILSNYGTTNASLVANRVLSVLYGVSPLNEAGSVSAADVKGIEGVYESLNAGSRLQKNYGKKPAFLTLSVDSNKVYLTRTGTMKTQLALAGKDLFFNRFNPYVQYKVERNSKGDVQGIRVSALFGAFGPERFNKRTLTPVSMNHKEQSADATTLAKYTGTYVHEFGERVKLYVEKESLKMKNAETGEVETLLFLGSNNFFVKDEDAVYSFETDAKKNISGFRYFNGAYDVVMKRVEEMY